MDKEKELAILHDHHKDSFAFIRDREKQRDRLFLILVGLLGFVLFQLKYANAHGMPELSAGGVKLDLSKLPAAVVLSTTWTYLVALTLRYCQVTSHVEKQYAYLHKLEEHISKLLENAEIYCREGKSYFATRDDLFRHWVWGFYTVLFPVSALGSIGLSGWVEWTSTTIPDYHKLFDLILATSSLFIITLYKGSEIVDAVKKKPST